MSKREEIVKHQIAVERRHQLRAGVRFFLFEFIPAMFQAAVLIACAFVLCGCFGG